MRTSRLATAALLSAFFMWPLAFPLGVIALIRITSRKNELGGRGLAIAATVIGLVFWVVFGVMTVRALPLLKEYSCRSKQAEAKTSLRHLRIVEVAYDAQIGRFGSLEEVKFQADNPGERYTVRLVSTDNAAAPRTFIAEAKSHRADLDGDTWTIDQDNTLINVANGCR